MNSIISDIKSTSEALKKIAHELDETNCVNSAKLMGKEASAIEKQALDSKHILNFIKFYTV